MRNSSSCYLSLTAFRVLRMDCVCLGCVCLDCVCLDFWAPRARSRFCQSRLRQSRLHLKTSSILHSKCSLSHIKSMHLVKFNRDFTDRDWQDPGSRLAGSRFDHDSVYPAPQIGRTHAVLPAVQPTTAWSRTAVCVPVLQHAALQTSRCALLSAVLSVWSSHRLT